MRPRQPLVDGDIDSAEAVTHTRIAVPQEDGSIAVKVVLESLGSPPPTKATFPIQSGNTSVYNDYNDDPMDDMNPLPSPQQKKSRVRIV